MIKRKILAGLLCGLLMINCSVNAELVDSISAGDGYITLTGSVENFTPEQLVTILLMKNDKNTNDLINNDKAINVISDAAAIMLDDEGNYTYTMPYSNSDGSIFVKSGSREQTIDINDYKEDGITVYLSPNGSDSAPGTAQDPLKTFDAARLKVRQIKKENPDTAITVYFMPGEYRISDTVAFTKEDSATARAPITYKALEEGTVKLKGSIEIPTTDLKKVTDPDVISRLPISAQDKVYCVDLADYSITDAQVQLRSTWGESIDDTITSPAPLGLYLNGQKQNIARWPNVGYNDFKDKDGNTQIINSGASWSYSPDSPERPFEEVGAKFSFDDVNPLRWTEADYMFIEGFLATSYDGSWRRVKEIDTENKTIELENGVVTAPYRRWTAVNLLEEIDMPSEFYVDRSDPDKLTLYYYPAYDLTQDDKLEFANCNSSLITLNDTQYLTFEGLNITQVYSDGIKGSRNNHITIDNCEISYTSGNGIYLTQTTDTVVKDSTVYNTYGNGIFVSANQDTDIITKLIPCGIKILNNHVYNVGFEIRTMGCGITAEGTSARVENNVVHLSTNRGGNASGVEAVTAYNEAYNLIRDTADAGAFYIGRTWTMYGTRYEYNYIHDLGIETYKDAENTSGVFLDDTISGHIFNNNIIVNDYVSGYKSADGTNMGTYGVNINGGRDFEIKNNIFIGMDYAVRNTDRTNSDTYFDTLNNQSLLVSLKDVVKKFPNSKYVQKYPGMLANYNEIIGTGAGAGSETTVIIKDQWGNDVEKRIIKTYGKFNPKNLDIDNNVVVDLQNDDADGVYLNGRLTGEFANTVKINNKVGNDYGIFENSEAQDYRIKSSAVESMGLGEDFSLKSDFDWSKIGMQNREIELGSDFKKLYPANGETSDKSQTASIAWEQALFADEYTYTVATDPELQNVAAQGTTIYKYAEIENLEPDTKYYWNVTAKNNSKQAANSVNTWSGSDGVFSFTTSKYDISAADAKLQLSDTGISLSVQMSNSSDQAQNGDFILAGFDENGKLTNLINSAKTIKTGLSEVIFETDNAAAESDYFCLYIWDGINGMKPLTNTKIYVRK